jgi:hypothetical protein
LIEKCDQMLTLELTGDKIIKIKLASTIFQR